MKALINFPEVTLLITHFNRSSSLEKLLNGFAAIEMQFGDVVVSDDCSNSEHLQKLYSLQREFGFRLLASTENRGLANNLNKGQGAVRTSLTLYVQEDFEPEYTFRAAFADAFDFMEEDKELDMVRFYAFRQYPYTRPFKKGFSEIYVPAAGINYKKIYAYSDHPHLRRSTFCKKFGKYVEGLKADRTEYRMCISFIQKKGKVLIYDDFQNLFKHADTKGEETTMKRSKLTTGNNLILNLVRSGYRQIRYNYDILFLKT